MRSEPRRGVSPHRALLVVLGLGILLSGCSSVPTYPPGDLGSAVRITDLGEWLTLAESSVPAKDLGIVFYPGGLVRPEAYLPALVPLAAAGYPVVVVKMPLDLAFFDSDKGLKARSSVPAVKHWVLAGHSLGGVAAAMAVHRHPGAFRGLVFWASYPAEGDDLSGSSVPVLSVSASHDGLSTPAKVAAAARLLPASARRIVIEGGNHAQFGTYGPQKGDGTATISREDQQSQVAAATLSFLEALSSP